MARLASNRQQPDLLASIFEERAENLSKAELQQWTTELPHDAEILRKLEGPGAKLLSGPRGSGKSTLLRRAYFELLDSSHTLPAYVNYAKSLALEPLLYTHANAIQIFRQWVLAKIVLGVYEASTAASILLSTELEKIADRSSQLIHALEVGNVPAAIDHPLSPSQLLLLLEKWTADCARKRCVLLLDDAAHAFSSEQQREFFEVFRALKSRVVSAKAAVYPGVTSYSPNFHLGHEAELVEAWFSPDDPSYLQTMRQLFDRRLAPTVGAKAKGREDLIDYAALASFGLPRAFLTILSHIFGLDEDHAPTPNRLVADQAVSAYAASVRSVFSSLSKKLPRFRKFIEVGQELEQAMLQTFRAFNYGRPLASKAVVIAIAEPLGSELGRMLSLMEYSGIVRKVGSFSRGNRGLYMRYSIHYALLIAEKALSLGKESSTENTIRALRLRDAHAVPHTRGATLLGADFKERCTIDLQPCRRCGAPRPSEDARFCMKCGAQLPMSSVYEDLLRTPIDRLPLTPHKIEGLMEHTTIKTVQDIMLDDESVKIRSVPGIGPVWAKRIHNAAEEFASV